MLGDNLSNMAIHQAFKLGSTESKENITKLFLDHNQISEISEIADNLANLQIL